MLALMVHWPESLAAGLLWTYSGVNGGTIVDWSVSGTVSGAWTQAGSATNTPVLVVPLQDGTTWAQPGNLGGISGDDLYNGPEVTSPGAGSGTMILDYSFSNFAPIQTTVDVGSFTLRANGRPNTMGLVTSPIAYPAPAIGETFTIALQGSGTWTLSGGDTWDSLFNDGTRENASYFGTTYTVVATTVPEPSGSMLMLGIVAFSAVVGGRRRKQP